MDESYVCTRLTCNVFPKICTSMDEMASHKLCEFQAFQNFKEKVEQSPFMKDLLQLEQIDTTYQYLHSIAQDTIAQIKESFEQTVAKLEQFVKEKSEDVQQSLKLFHMIQNSQIEELRSTKSKVDDYLVIDSKQPSLKLVKDKLNHFKGLKALILKHFDQFQKTLEMKLIESVTFEWDILKSNQIKLDGDAIIQTSNCSTSCYILSKDPLSKYSQSYFEILRQHTEGCYDSIGLCIKKEIGIRNGENKDGWALRLHGSNNSPQFTGLIHNGVTTKFFESWQADDKIGVLYDPIEGTITYFRNKKSLGKPFKDVFGELYICVENCHKTGFVKINEPEIPELTELVEEQEALKVQE